MSRVRVLRVIARMNVGGPALQVTGLIRGLDPAEFDHRVVTGLVDEGEADYLELRAPDVTVVRLAALGRRVRPLDDARALARLVRELRSFRPHIVHTHTAKAGLLGRVAARIAGVPCTVHTFHGHLLHGYFRPGVSRGVNALERRLARRTTRLVAVGARVRDELLAAGIGSAAQYVVIPPGIELGSPLEAAECRRELGLPEDVPVVGFVARLTGVKRPDRFMAAALLIARSRPDAHFVLAGEGELLDSVRAAGAPLGDRLHLLGWRPDVDVVYGASDVVMLTSDNEGMPVSLIEAAAAGRPAVTTDVGSAREVVLDGVTGTVTGPTAEELATAVLALLDDPEQRHRMAGAARAHAESAFGVDRLVQDTTRLYRSLIGGGLPTNTTQKAGPWTRS